jgi:hypothetical protein
MTIVVEFDILGSVRHGNAVAVVAGDYQSCVMVTGGKRALPAAVD